MGCFGCTMCNGMRRLFLSILLSLSVLVGASAGRFTTSVLDDNIATLQVLPHGEQLRLPVIELNSDDDWVTISFDEFGYEASQFNYRIVHCDANWNASGISSMEFVDGFDNGYVNQYDYSLNTTVNYINYSISLPNDDVRFNVSGNYAVLIARDNDFDNGLVAVACFSVVEPLAVIGCDVSGRAIAELNGRYQQLDIQADVRSVGATQPMQDFIMVVRQNGRADSERVFTRPTFVNGHQLQWQNSRDLMFEAGNQYRSIDFSSRYTYGAGIDRIVFDNDMYHVEVEPQQIRKYRQETRPYDAHGDYAVNFQGGDMSNVEADYMWVDWVLPMDKPFWGAEMHLLGALTGNVAGEMSLVEYDFVNKMYRKSLKLKQGGYNYLFALKNSRSGAVSVLETEGSYYQAVNRYEVYLYYRPFGARYDRLVGVWIME